MKALQISSAITLNNGIEIAAGSVVIINEGLAQPFRQSTDELGLITIPGQINVSLFLSKEAYEAGKNSVPPESIADFSSNQQVFIPLAQYQTVPAESMLVNSVLIGLNAIYPGKVEIIEVTPPSPLAAAAAPSADI